MVSDYITPAEFRAAIKDDTDLDASVVAAAISSASRRVEGLTGRHFYQTTETNYFTPNYNDPFKLTLADSDLATTNGLTVHVQWSNHAGYPEQWLVDTDFVCEPVGSMVNGIEGWPFTWLRSLAKMWPPRYADFTQETVKIDGTWGWPAIPEPIKTATTILAVEMFKQPSDAPFGVAGFDTYGAVRMRDNPLVVAILQPYKKHTTLLMA